MTIRALRQNAKIKEFPTIENNRIAGISQAPSISTGFTFLRCLLKELTKKRASSYLIQDDICNLSQVYYKLHHKLFILKHFKDAPDVLQIISL
jgi:hypothetical protein